ncbi:MAG: DUF1684 domain-containing protein [Acidobacteriota bacterium]
MRCHIALTAAAVLLSSCATQPAAKLDPAYSSEIEQWRSDREKRLKADDGWLTLVGLFWLNEGANKIGSDPNAEVPLPSSVPAQVGTMTLSKGKVHFKPAAGVALKETDLLDDNQPNYNVQTLGSVRFYLIERGGRHGIRVKDPQSPARTNFAGLDWYSPDPTWNVEATLVPAPHKVTFDTEVGLQQEGDSPGYLEFDRAGTHYRVEPVTEDEELFLVLRDATSGKTTYAASRFLYTKLPDKEGHTRLDFNKAYNPPCVFTPYATCPLPPMQNRLTSSIEAGEKIYRGPSAH